MSKLSRLLKKLRADSRESLRFIQDATGVSNAYLSQLENGKIKEPSPQVLRKLATFYGVRYLDFLFAAGYLKDRDLI